MSNTKEKIIQTSGKRKRAIARATAKKGKGTIKINNIPLNSFSNEIYRLRIKEPVRIAGEIAEKMSINVAVFGGGVSSQAEAIRLAIAKAIVEYSGSEELKKKYVEYDRTLLVADTRYKEVRKPMTHSKARRKRQQSYR